MVADDAAGQSAMFKNVRWEWSSTIHVRADAGGMDVICARLSLPELVAMFQIEKSHGRIWEQWRAKGQAAHRSLLPVMELPFEKHT